MQCSHGSSLFVSNSRSRNVRISWSQVPGFVVRGLLAGLLLGVVGSTPAIAQQYTVEEATLDGGGGTVSANGIQMTSSIGGASPVGTVQSGPFVLYSGVPSPLSGGRAIVVQHDPGEEGRTAEAGRDYTVTAQIVANQAPLEEVFLYYRTGEDPTATEVEMTGDGPNFSATIPGSAIGETGFAYYFVATDVSGNTVRAPPSGVYSRPVTLDDPGVRKSSGMPGGTTQSAYRLLSMPLELDDPSPEAVLGDDIETLSSSSSYDPSEARLFEPLDTRVAEFPRISDFELGKAFWLIVREGVEEVDSGSGTVRPLDDPVEIELEPGWNFVGTPFTVEVPISNVRTEDGASVVLREYDSDGYNTPEDPVQMMRPFEGYALFAEGNETLVVEPPVSDEETMSQSKRTSPPFPWHLRVNATGPAGKDVDNVAAVHSEAREGWGNRDWLEPPALFSGLSVAFDAPEEAPGDRGLSADVRPEPVRGTTWPLTVRADTMGAVHLTVHGVETVPSHFEVWLIDSATKTSWNLRNSTEATLELLADDPERSLRLLVGTNPYVTEALEDHEAFPQEYVFEQPYPNPSDGPVALRFGLPTEEAVSIAIYNVLGQKVAQLHDETSMEAGYHTVTWDGNVSSGMYFVRMEAGAFRSVQKLVRVR